MEYHFWISLFLMIYAGTLRFDIYQKNKHALWLILYAAVIFIAAALFNSSLRQVSLNIAEAKLGNPSALVIDTFDPVILISHVYSSYDFILWLFSVIFLLEACAVISAKLAHTILGKKFIGSFARWWANAIILIAVPALSFALASMGSSHKHELTNIAYTLTPLHATYGAPAYLSQLRPLQTSTKEPETFAWSAHYPHYYQATLLDFSRDTAPWFLLCLIITFLAMFKPINVTNKNIKKTTLRALFLGDARWSTLLKKSTLRQLPWRGKYLLAYLSAIFFLVSLAIICNILFYALILVMWNLIWIAPLLLVLLIIFTASKLIAKNKSPSEK